MPDWLSEPGDTLVAIIREIAREEAVRVLLEHNRSQQPRGDAGFASDSPNNLVITRNPRDPGTEDPSVCGATDAMNRVCQKPPHRGRHKFMPRPHIAPARPWEPIEEVIIESGSRHYPIKVHNPVKVQGLGKGGAAADGYIVVSMERHTETGKVNVEVVKVGKGQRSRVVTLDRILYKRPAKGT